jgi:large subunit ribosomal protein L39e
MATHKPAGKKRRLSRRHRMRRAVPTWVVSKTRGHVRSHPKKKNWRDGRLKA